MEGWKEKRWERVVRVVSVLSRRKGGRMNELYVDESERVTSMSH